MLEPRRSTSCRHVRVEGSWNVGEDLRVSATTSIGIRDARRRISQKKEREREGAHRRWKRSIVDAPADTSYDATGSI
jgi:hypothetical protein